MPDRAWAQGYVTPGDDLPSDASRLLSQAIRRDDAPQTTVIPDREAIERVLGSPRLVRALVPGGQPACAAGVGGDWVNSFPLPDRHTALVAGDVGYAWEPRQPWAS